MDSISMKKLEDFEKNLSNIYEIAIMQSPKPPNMSNSQYINYLAIQLLETAGNDFPTQEEIDTAEKLILEHSKEIKLTRQEISPHADSFKEKTHRSNIFLTYNEAYCAIAILEMHSYEEIALFLNLNINQVLSILENLKNLFGCNTYRELRKKLTKRLDN